MKRFVSILLAMLLIISVMPATAFAASTKTVYVSGNGTGTLNLRSGAGYGYSVVGYVNHNDKVTVKSKSGSWSKVKLQKNGKVGWIRTIYIDGTTKSLCTGYHQLKASSGEKIYVRAKASSSSAVRGVITKGATFQVYYFENDYVSIRMTNSSLSGWIPRSRVGSAVKLSADKPPVSSKTVYHTTASTLNLRKGPGTGYAVIGGLPRNTACTVVKSSGNWRQIHTAHGAVGWVSANYLAKKATARINASALNVRKGAGTDSAVLGSLKRGTQFTVSYTAGNWSYGTGGKLTGYVYTKYLRY